MNRHKFLQLARGAVAAVAVGKAAVTEPQAAPVVAPSSEGIHDIHMTYERPYYSSRHMHSYDKAGWLGSGDTSIYDCLAIPSGNHKHRLERLGGE